ncbi:hypothetical protein IT412_04655 [Candidatus Peregrinibacteria bacterium]|nr:hypothetical protein [Candidatus Peregrinibacteria bacterium]
MNIITKRDLQKGIAKIGDSAYTVVNRGKPEMIIVPYFDGSEAWVEDYLEDYEMFMNKKRLKMELKKSLDSGLSDLKI